MFAVLYISDFGLQAVLRTESISGDVPAALFTDATKKPTATMVNAVARDFGVEPGITAPQALARCPALIIRMPNATAEADARAALLAVGFTVSPAIEDTAPGVCTIDLKGTDPRQRERSASAAVAKLAELGLSARAGIAATPLLALFGARDHRQNEVCRDPQRTPAPAGVFTVTDPAAFLGPLLLAAADPSPAIMIILASWGLRTFGELTALPRDDVGRRLGPEGLALWDRASGGETRPLSPVVPTRTFAATMDFEEEVETIEPLLFILRRFLERLTLELATTSQVAASLDLTLKLSDDAKHERSFRLPEPTANVEILFRALHTHLESLRTDSPIAGLELHVTPTRPLVRQHGLFDTSLRDPHGFAETLARLVATVGSDRVGTPVLQNTYRPDAVKLIRPASVVPAAAPPPRHPRIGLPLRRFRPALVAQLELTEGKPTYIWTDRFAGSIADVRGPWVSSGEWWQPDRSWRRTEYDIALANGGLYRLVYADRNWLIEGEYD